MNLININRWHRILAIFGIIALSFSILTGVIYADQRDDLIDYMEASQAEIDDTMDQLEARVTSININDPRKDDAVDKLDLAKSAVNDFKGLDASNHVDQDPLGPDESWVQAEKDALEAMATVNRVLIAPTRPGNVPQGDILEDFAPQLVKLLFGFTTVVILIAFITSGVYMIISFDNEEKVTKAKHMIYYSLIGFAFVVFAFAIVQAVTDIDFFKFI
ncbi:pilin [Patescibacteria group bacterium]|nr:pilin [Patescibacteria group bacterium]